MTDDRNNEPRNSEAVEQVARLIEQSSFGTVGARQLRDRTSTADRDRVMLQASFSATADGRAWWRRNRNDAEALYYAAAARFRSGHTEDRELGERLMNLAAELGHPEARAVHDTDAVLACERDGQPASDRLLSNEPAESSGRNDVMLRAEHVNDHSPGTDWRSFERFFSRFLEPLTITLADELSLRVERSREALLQAMKAAFDKWEDISTVGCPEEWVLGYALQRQRHEIVHFDCTWHVVVFDGCSWRKPRSRPASADRGMDLMIIGDLDVLITGAMVTAVQSKITATIDMPAPVAQLVVDCKRYLTKRYPDVTADRSCLIDVDEAVTGFYTHSYRSTVRLATLLVGEASPAEEIAVTAFDAAYRAWRQNRRSFDITVAALHRSLVNQARAVARYHETRRLTQQGPPFQSAWDAEDGSNPEPGITVLTALQRLPVRQREALILRYYADLDITEIGDAMGVSPSTALTHIHRGTEKLQWFLNHLHFSPHQRQRCGQLNMGGLNLGKDGDKVP